MVTCDTAGTCGYISGVQLFSDRKRTRMFLTSLAIQNARPKQKPYKLADGDG